MVSVAVETECGNEEAQVSSSYENTEIERSKVGIMRAPVEREDPSAKSSKLLLFAAVFFFLLLLNGLEAAAICHVHMEVDDLMIRRFLRARELDIENGSLAYF
ncbi:hypothetical protein RHMOL_Rhmol12G0106300 [Rhododendron molle]|uniref:Uncharacterized protein n=1 Tax=Rhododendron molle TaxID=49168 RepID=A0ACC0LH04_RHOML|nr:hypothetical protein RHMOL_Rhmol12G0106300 [Rhododendron molle]